LLALTNEDMAEDTPLVRRIAEIPVSVYCAL